MRNKKIIFIFIFMFIVQSAYANTTKDFLREFICNIYTEYKGSNNDTMRNILASGYKYANSSIRLIEKYENKVSMNHSRKLISMKNTFVHYRGVLDNVMEVSYSSNKSNLSALHNMLNDDGLGVLFDLIKIYGIDNSQLMRYADRLDSDEKDIKEQIFSLIEDVDPYHRLNCN